jgi:class 3 adenylate cyclase
MRVIGGGQSPLNRRLCKWCIKSVHKHPGGAEVDLSVLFADVRGSTGIAEHMEPEEFSRLMARFYGAAAEVIDEQDGIVDKFVGDTVNTAARLSALAGPGEILISREAGEAARLETAGLERRTLELRGKDQTVDVWGGDGGFWSGGSVASRLTAKSLESVRKITCTAFDSDAEKSLA